MTEDLRRRSDLERQLHKLNQRLHHEYDARLGPGVVDQCVTAAKQRVARSRVPDFKPLLIERYAREALNHHRSNDNHRT